MSSQSSTRPAGAGSETRAARPHRPSLPGQVVLVFQGGGALGAFQPGVYEAMHEAGIEPDWVVGTSIGAINGAIIAGNPAEQRLERLHEFWARLGQHNALGATGPFHRLGKSLVNMNTLTRGIPGFFTPNLAALFGPFAPLGLDAASFYSTAPLRESLEVLIDFDYLRSRALRLTVGAVSASSGAMRYFDSRDGALTVDHVMASGALPGVFPAVRIDGEPFWDGGVYSNTPAEVVFDDNPRRDSVIFAAQLWNPQGDEPRTMGEVGERQKDIQFSSRAASHIRRHQQIHNLRHVITELARRLPEDARGLPEVRELTAWGCRTTMHVINLLSPRLGHDDHSKDIDFTSEGIAARWKAGYDNARRAIAAAPWSGPVDPSAGVLIHDIS